MKDKSLTFASLAAAGLASLCCIGPLDAGCFRYRELQRGLVVLG